MEFDRSEYITIPLNKKDPKTGIKMTRRIKKTELHPGAYSGSGSLNLCPACGKIFPHHDQKVHHDQNAALLRYYQQADRNVREHSKIAFINYPNRVEDACPFKCDKHKTVTFVISLSGDVFCGHCIIEAIRDAMPQIGSFSQKINLEDIQGLRINKENDKP